MGTGLAVHVRNLIYGRLFCEFDGGIDIIILESCMHIAHGVCIRRGQTLAGIPSTNFSLKHADIPGTPPPVRDDGALSSEQLECIQLARTFARRMALLLNEEAGSLGITGSGCRAYYVSTNNATQTNARTYVAYWKGDVKYVCNFNVYFGRDRVIRVTALNLLWDDVPISERNAVRLSLGNRMYDDDDDDDDHHGNGSGNGLGMLVTLEAKVRALELLSMTPLNPKPQPNS